MEKQRQSNGWFFILIGFLVSLPLAHWVNHNWLWFTAFVGANLFQSSLTCWCLMGDILVKLSGAKREARVAS